MNEFQKMKNEIEVSPPKNCNFNDLLNLKKQKIGEQLNKIYKKLVVLKKETVIIGS